jgi:hypothetical protein
MAPASLPGEELQFLRLQSLTASDSEPRGHHGWRYLVLSLAVVLGGFMAFDRYYRPPISLPEVAASMRPGAIQPASENQAEQPPQPERLQVPFTHSKPQELPAVKPAARIVNTSGRTAAAFDNGTQELAQAERLLEAGSDRDPARAAVWLWKAVGKKNTEAAVMLADLYSRGDGIPQSCLQATVLLRAAVRQGSGEAGEKLRGLEARCK